MIESADKPELTSTAISVCSSESLNSSARKSRKQVWLKSAGAFTPMTWVHYATWEMKSCATARSRCTVRLPVSTNAALAVRRRLCDSLSVFGWIFDSHSEAMLCHLTPFRPNYVFLKHLCEANTHRTFILTVVSEMWATGCAALYLWCHLQCDIQRNCFILINTTSLHALNHKQNENLVGPS